jgi:hypothetical protein
VNRVFGFSHGVRRWNTWTKTKMANSLATTFRVSVLSRLFLSSVRCVLHCVRQVVHSWPVGLGDLVGNDTIIYEIVRWCCEGSKSWKQRRLGGNDGQLFVGSMRDDCGTKIWYVQSYRIKFHRHKSRERKKQQTKNQSVSCKFYSGWWASCVVALTHDNTEKKCYWPVNNTSGKKHVDSFLAG